MLRHRTRRLIGETVASASRRAEAKSEVARNVSSESVKRRLDNVTSPNSPSSTAKKVGIALIAAPDPLTGIPGVALLASAYALRKKDPANLGHLALETRKVLRDLQSFSV